MKIMVAGTGGVVYFLARLLASRGHDLVVITTAGEEARTFARRLRATVVHGDPTRATVLEDAGAGTVDSVMAVGQRDETNLAICLLASRRFGVGRVFAIVNDPDNEQLFRAVGVETTFSVTSLVVRLIERIASFDSVVHLFPAALGQVDVSEIRIDRNARAAGVPLRDLHLPEGSLVASIIRRTEVIVPRGDTALDEGDTILLVTRSDVFEAALTRIVGNR